MTLCSALYNVFIVHQSLTVLSIIKIQFVLEVFTELKSCECKLTKTISMKKTKSIYSAYNDNIIKALVCALNLMHNTLTMQCIIITLSSLFKKQCSHCSILLQKVKDNITVKLKSDKFTASLLKTYLIIIYFAFFFFFLS